MINRIIDLEIATVCLYWAQSFIECKTPLFTSAQLTYKSNREYTLMNSAGDDTIYRVVFLLQHTTPTPTYKGEVRTTKPGMIIRVTSDNTNILVCFISCQTKNRWEIASSVQHPVRNKRLLHPHGALSCT